MAVKFNWIDVLIIISILRSLYVGFRDGLSAEIIRLTKNIATLIIALHTYQTFGNLLHFNSLYSAAVAKAIAFTLIVIVLYVTFYLIEKFIKIILKFSFISGLEQYGGMSCGALRSLISVATLMFMLSLMPVSFVVKQVSVSSLLGHALLNSFPRYYDNYIETYLQGKEPKKFKLNDYYNYLNRYMSAQGKDRQTKTKGFSLKKLLTKKDNSPSKQKK